MPHFAELDDNNTVLRVTYSNDDEQTALLWLLNNLGGRWQRCFYNTPPHRYPGPGWTWNEVDDNFDPPAPPPDVIP